MTADTVHEPRLPNGWCGFPCRPRWVAAVLTLVLLTGLILACGGKSRSPDEKAVEKALRAFEKASRAEDPEALLAVTTEPYVKEHFGNIDLASGALPEGDVTSILGKPIDRRIESITVKDDAATILAFAHVQGGLDTDATEVRLVRRDGKWLVDYTGARTTEPAKDATLITMELKDFSFVYQPADFQRDKPFVIRAKNTGGQAHMVAIWKVPPEANLIKMIEATDVPPDGLEHLVNSVVFNKGEEGDIIMSKGLKPGRYMLTCFLSDITTPELVPHYDRGMVTEFEVK